MDLVTAASPAGSIALIVRRVTRLIDPTHRCSKCGDWLDDVASEYLTDGDQVVFDDWRARVLRTVIRCPAGHCFEARYEEREPWLSVLVGVGEEIS